jgi:hypothetical protein
VGEIISRTRPFSPIELKIREFLKGKGHAGPSVSATLVRIHKWIGSTQDQGIDASRIGAKAARNAGSDVIEVIAESLIENARGAERRLLLKSLEEALFYAVDFAAEIDYPQFKTRFTRYLHRHGTSSILQRFLSLYFFNFVWYHTGESFRALAATSDSFAQDIESVERLCQKTVTSAWRSFETSQQFVDLSSAKELVRSIEQNLRGGPARA